MEEILDKDIEISEIVQFAHVDGLTKEKKFAGFNIFKAKLKLKLSNKDLILPIGFTVIERHTLYSVTLAKIDTTNDEAERNIENAKIFFKKNNLNYEEITQIVSQKLIVQLELKF